MILRNFLNANLFHAAYAPQRPLSRFLTSGETQNATLAQKRPKISHSLTSALGGLPKRAP